MDLWSSAKYRQEADKNGVSERVAAEALRQAHGLQRGGFPPVLSLRHLAQHVDSSYLELRDIVCRRVDAYRSFPIKKKPSGYRIICVPSSMLMRTQRWISDYILENLKPSSSSYAYNKGNSALECARVHSGCSWLIKVDVQRFFESIDETQVYRIFRECGYQALLAFELARITTRLPLAGKHHWSNRWRSSNPNRYSIKSYQSKLLGHLPQGAPTSPRLSNLVMRPFDRTAEQIAGEYDLNYTRYSDDIVLSSFSSRFDRRHAAEIIQRLYGLMGSFNLHPKSTKTTVVPPDSRRLVLGLVVNNENPRLTKEWRRKLECHVYYIRKLGYVVHGRRRGFESAMGCYKHVQGLIAYARQVEPRFGDEVKASLLEVPPPF